MHIAVLVKQVPDTYGQRTLGPGDWLIDRSGEVVLDEIDSRGLEVGLQLVEKHGGDVTAITMGPDSAVDVLRKALAMGAARAVHVVDDALAGSDAAQTSAVLASVLAPLAPDLVITGNESTDGRTGSLAGMLAERLNRPALTSLVSIDVDGETVRCERVVDDGSSFLRSSLPAVVSVNEKCAEPRYPTFKGIMAAKKKPIERRSAAEIGVERIGLTSAATQVVDGTARPARQAGVKIVDDGGGGTAIADFLTAQQLV